MTVRSSQPDPPPTEAFSPGAAATSPGAAATAILGVHVRYFAGARAAAGVSEETVRLPRQGSPADSAAVSVADVLEAILALHDEALARVVAASSFLLDGIAVRDRSIEVTEGAQLDVLPPFAGG